MAVERLTIVNVEPGRLHLAPRDDVYCGKCSARGVCGQQLLHTLFQAPEPGLTLASEVITPASCRPGDTLEVSLDDGWLVKLSCLLYLVPLGAFLLATALASVLARSQAYPELLVILAAGVALAGTLVIMRRLNGRVERKVQSLLQPAGRELQDK